jgi:hypothetical protein
MCMSFRLLETYIRNSFLFFFSFFHPPTYRETTIETMIRTRIYVRGEVSFVKFLFLPSLFVKLLHAIFSCFAKIRWMSSWFAKLLELLAASTFERTNNFLRIFLHMERSDMPLSDHLQEFVNFYLPNLVFCQLLKRYAK